MKLFSILISLLFLTACQSDLFGNAVSAIPVEQADCIDSDNGVNFREPGTATLTYNDGRAPAKIKDRCTFSGKLFEGRCKPETFGEKDYWKLMGVKINCPSEPISTVCQETPNGAFCNPQ